MNFNEIISALYHSADSGELFHTVKHLLDKEGGSQTLIPLELDDSGFYNRAWHQDHSLILEVEILTRKYIENYVDENYRGYVPWWAGSAMTFVLECEDQAFYESKMEFEMSYEIFETYTCGTLLQRCLNMISLQKCRHYELHAMPD